MASCCSWKNKGLSGASLQQREGVRSAVRNLQCECWVPRGPGTRQGEDPASCSWTEVPLECGWTRLDPTWSQVTRENDPRGSNQASGC